MRRRTTLGDRNLVGENIIRIRAEKKMSQGELLSQIQLMGIDMNQRRLQKKIRIFFLIMPYLLILLGASKK